MGSWRGLGVTFLGVMTKFLIGADHNRHRTFTNLLLHIGTNDNLKSIGALSCINQNFL